jgi:hypothetical protein
VDVLSSLGERLRHHLDGSLEGFDEVIVTWDDWWGIIKMDGLRLLKELQKVERLKRDH